PGKRVYLNAGSLRPVRQGYGIAILTTPRGIVTGREAKKLHVGGELVCEVW
ncbi:MAG: 30S ribosomal protein S8, partial [Parcubacteria group bacterium]|nr:30S ribosomal protein S8 [Parcubacteria group bacterium]